MSANSLAPRSSFVFVAVACSALATLAARADPPAHAGPPKAARSPAEEARAAPPKVARSPAEEARTRFERGVIAHDAGKLEDAERLFTEAWGFQRSWDIAANLGIVEHKLRKHAAAAEHLSFALAALPPSESDKVRTGLARKLAEAASKVGKLTVRSDVAGAVVRVGGHIRGTLPLEGPLFEAPGRVHIEVSKDGFEAASQTVTVAAGGAVSVALSPAPRAERPLAGPIVAFGAAGAGLVTGLVAGGVSLAKMEELRPVCDGGRCPESRRADADLGRAAGHVATAGFVTAGAFAAVGLTFLLLAPAKGTPAKMGISAGPTFVGVKGEF